MRDSIPGDDALAAEEDKRAPRQQPWRTLTAIGAATWLVSTQLAGCAPLTAEGEAGEGSPVSLTADGEGGEGMGGEGGEGIGGEGAGGEGEGAATEGAVLATDDVAYLTQLGLIRGHLAVGFELYRRNLPELAQTHMKHPRAEIYSQVVPAFAARGCQGFGDGLTALTKAVTEEHSQERVATVYRDLTQAIAACEAGAAIDNPTTITAVIENLLRTAGIEYQIGIIDGEVNNLHEYQDAWGFTQIAESWARSAAYSNSERATAVASQLQDLIKSLQPMWPSLNPDGNVESDASQLFGAAGRVEVTALSLNP